MPDAPDIIKELVDQYHSNRDQYMSAAYNEEQARAEFINPFFEALGWDVRNKQGNSPAYMDVVFEGTIRVEGNANAPDYTFRVGQKRMFFVEAKKPKERLEFQQDHARQIRRYSWTAKLPLGILTNFHELAVYDCRLPPKPDDKASHARLKYIKYTEYPERWDEIASVFGKRAVWEGAFDKYAKTDKGKRGTAEVDQEFLKQIEEWRTVLARNIALRNVGIDVRELNYAVQNTIDRIVFLRMCEDRGIEPQGQLLGRTSGPNVYGRLLDLYHAADAKYNSGLFHFTEEKGRTEAPDTITPGLRIDDKALRDMIAGLYYPKSPYEFSVIGADILGSVYEQFLGKVIRLTPGHTAMVEEKPEVKKAGGVYYTPTYIVDYIVKNTVGKLCEGKTPKEVAKLRVVDPACGSGSFLINAYAFLLNWHLDYYVKHEPEKHKKEIYRLSESEWRLATQEKKRILLNSIYGVDIDSQAVEVTKLSLLLKVLEGESRDTLDVSLSMFRERALPDLTANIKCGNSLIGTDFDTSGLGDDEIRRINPFDWATEFPEIMGKAGGFDAVIGNPPWVFTRDVSFGEPAKEYFASHYMGAKGKINLYALFICHGVELLSPSGWFSMIVPNTFLRATTYQTLREHIIRDFGLEELTDTGTDVFKGVTASTVILLVTKQHETSDFIVAQLETSGSRITVNTIARDSILANPGFVIDLYTRKSSRDIIDQIRDQCRPLSDYVQHLISGIQTWKQHKSKFISDAPLNSNYKPLLEGRDIGRYQLRFDDKFIYYSKTVLNVMQDEAIFLMPEKVLIQRVSGGKQPIKATLDVDRYYCFNSINTLVCHTIDNRYALGILNSRLMNWLYSLTFSNRSQLTVNIATRNLRSLPIHPINFDDPKDKARHDKMVELVDRMLDLPKKLDAATLPNDKTQIQRQIAATDREIDRLVYELYGLTDEEIKIVEGSG